MCINTYVLIIISFNNNHTFDECPGAPRPRDGVLRRRQPAEAIYIYIYIYNIYIERYRYMYIHIHIYIYI